MMVETTGEPSSSGPVARKTMTNAERAVALYQLYLQLDELITAEELETYPFLEHLGDLISDLEEE